MRSPGTAPVSGEMLQRRGAGNAAHRHGELVAIGLARRRLAAEFLELRVVDGEAHGLQHVDGGELAPADGGQRVIDILVAEARDGGGHLLFDIGLAELGQHLFHDLAAKAGKLLAHGGPRGAADGGARLAGDGEAFPCGGRHLRVGADDLHLIAVLSSVTSGAWLPLTLAPTQLSPIEVCTA